MKTSEITLGMQVQVHQVYSRNNRQVGKVVGVPDHDNDAIKMFRVEFESGEVYRYPAEGLLKVIPDPEPSTEDLILNEMKRVREDLLKSQTRLQELTTALAVVRSLRQDAKPVVFTA